MNFVAHVLFIVEGKDGIWTRAWRKSTCRISSPVHSTTLPPFQWSYEAMNLSKKYTEMPLPPFIVSVKLIRIREIGRKTPQQARFCYSAFS